MRSYLTLLLPVAAIFVPSALASSLVQTRAGSADYTYGGSCEVCAPFPGENLCDITTSCTFVYGHTGPLPAPLYCACRHGYRADNVAPGDSDSQWRLDWAGQEGRVFVKPGLACNTLCDDWQLGKDGCKAVAVRDQCL